MRDERLTSSSCSVCRLLPRRNSFPSEESEAEKTVPKRAHGSDSLRLGYQGQRQGKVLEGRGWTRGITLPTVLLVLLLRDFRGNFIDITKIPILKHLILF